MPVFMNKLPSKSYLMKPHENGVFNLGFIDKIVIKGIRYLLFLCLTFVNGIDHKSKKVDSSYI